MWKQTKFLENKLKEYYKAKSEPRKREKLSASDTGCVLHRQLKLWKVKPDREQTWNEAMTFDFGNMVHWFLQKRLQDMEILELKEVELEDDLTIGHADALVRENGKLVPYEFKSIKDYGLDRIVQEGKPQDNHIKQLIGGYFRLLKKLKLENLADYAKIVYLAKCFDDSHRGILYKGKDLGEERTVLRFVEFAGEYDPNLATKVEEENKIIQDAVKAHEPLSCSELDTTYHRDERWNQYLTWCAATPDENKQRLNLLLLSKEVK